MIKYIILIVLIIPGVSGGNNSHVELNHDWEDVNKTIIGIEQIFNEKNTDNIKKLGSTLFINSDGYEQLVSLVLETNVSFVYSMEYANKSFQIKKGENNDRELNISFFRKKDRYWYISNAYIIDANGEIIEFEEKGFRPLALEYNFSGFINEIKHGKISNYSGLAPYGKLPPSFFTKNELSPLKKSNLLIKNILLRYNNGDIAGFYFMEFEYTPDIDDRKRGWLLTGFGSMKNYVLEHSSNMYEKFLVSGNQVVHEDVNNNEGTSPYSFSISVIEEVKKIFSNLLKDNNKASDKLDNECLYSEGCNENKKF